MTQLKERLLTFAEVAELIPFPVSRSTFGQWQKRGVRGIKLETVMIGGRRLVPEGALERFLNALNQAEPVA